MLLIQHRVNTTEQLCQTPSEFGVELDLRDHGNDLIVQHDPFTQGVSFDAYLEHVRHRTLILNVKSERIEWRVLEAIRRHGIEDYFFLDCSFPMIRELVRSGEHRIAVRYSEFEPIEMALSLAGQVNWIWVDCFSHLPLDSNSHARLAEHFKLCLVSPELHGRDVSQIASYADQVRDWSIDAVCTKRPDLWRAALPGICTDA